MPFWNREHGQWEILRAWVKDYWSQRWGSYFLHQPHTAKGPGLLRLGESSKRTEGWSICRNTGTPQPLPPHPLLPQPEEEASVPVYSLGQGRAHNRRQLHGNTRPSLCCAALSLGSPCGGGSPSAPEGNTPLPALLGVPHAGLLASGCRTCLPGHSVCRPPSDPPFHTRLSCLWNRWDHHCEQNATFLFFICFFFFNYFYYHYYYLYCLWLRLLLFAMLFHWSAF